MDGDTEILTDWLSLTLTDGDGEMLGEADGLIETDSLALTEELFEILGLTEGDRLNEALGEILADIEPVK